MSKIFGDKYKEEIRSLKKLDRSLLKCKADIERVIHYIESKKSFTNINVKLTEAIGTIIKLSTEVESLLQHLDETEEIFDGMSAWVRLALMKKKSYVIDLNRMSKVRLGAERLVSEYKDILSVLGKKYREKNNEQRI